MHDADEVMWHILATWYINGIRYVFMSVLVASIGGINRLYQSYLLLCQISYLRGRRIVLIYDIL